MSRVRVEIDLNSRDANGVTRARLSRANGPLRKGQIVTAFESEDEVQALAYVDAVDSDRGYVFLTVNWDSLTDDNGTEVRAHGYASSMTNRAHAAAENRRAQRAAVGGSTEGHYRMRTTSSISR